MSKEKQSNNYLDSRTSAERKKDIKIKETTTSTPPQSDWEKDLKKHYIEFDHDLTGAVLIYENILQRFISTLLQQARAEVLKSCGDCKNCYGRGYHTTLEYAGGIGDFEGEKGIKYQLPLIRFCNCDRGKELKKHFEIMRVETLKEVLPKEKGKTGFAQIKFGDNTTTEIPIESNYDAGFNQCRSEIINKALKNWGIKL